MVDPIWREAMTRALIVVGLGFGDEGKGSIVDYLVREHDARLVVRFNGGAQAAHSVVSPEGSSHTFRQFGSGTLAGASTHLSRDVLVNPVALMLEAEELGAHGLDRDPLSTVTIDPRAAVTTPFHSALNKLLELARGDQRHGSCGFGIAETVRDVLAGTALRYHELGQPDLGHRLEELQLTKRAKADLLRPPADWPALVLWEEAMKVLTDPVEADAALEVFQTVAARVPPLLLSNLDTSGTVVYEGAQGALLDEVHGFAPFNTWSDCTPAAAEKLARRTGADSTTIGVLRGYLTRHGPGPLPTESDLGFVDERNLANPWQGELRYGWADLVLASYAARYAPVDELAVTHLDELEELAAIPVATGWEIGHSGLSEAPEHVTDATTRMALAAQPVYRTVSLERLLERLGYVVAPVTLVSRGPTAEDKATKPRGG